MKNYSNFLKEEETKEFRIAVQGLSGEYRPVEFKDAEKTFETKEKAVDAIHKFFETRSGHVNKPKVYKFYCDEEELKRVDEQEQVYVVEPFKKNDKIVPKGKWCSQEVAGKIVDNWTTNILPTLTQ